MKRIFFLLSSLFLAATASGQIIDIAYHLTSAAYPLNGGVQTQFVGPYSGTPALGDFIYFNGTNWVSLNKPADGTYSVTFTAGIPSWAAGGGGGLGDPGANGMVVRTALNTTTARTLVCTATYCSWTNGSGVSGAPSLVVSLNTTDDGGGIVKQATSPGTQQGSGGNANINVNGVIIQETDALGAASANGQVTQNTTAATAGTTQQFSPSQTLCGTAWNTGGPGPSETDCWRINNAPGSANPTTNLLRFQSSIAGGAYANEFTLSGTGAATFTGAISETGNVTVNGNNATVNMTGTTSGSGGTQQATSNGGVFLYTANHLVSASCTSGTTCDSTTNIPANAVVLSVGWKVTTAITGATTVNLGTATNGTAFCTGLTGGQLALNATGVCGGGATVGNGVDGAAVALRATATAGTYTAGVISYTIAYILVTPPTS